MDINIIMSDDDYPVAEIGKFYRRNNVEVSDTCIKDTTRPGPLYTTGLQWGNNEDREERMHLYQGRPVVKVTNAYATRRHGIKIAYEMANYQQYFICTYPYYSVGYPLSGPFESSLSDFFHAFRGPYDNPDGTNDNPDGTNNTSSSSTTTTIDLRTPTKQSTPQQGEVQHIQTIPEEELDRKQLESAQKNRSGQLGDGGKAGYVNLVTPSPDNNNNNVKKRARVSSGSGSSSSGSSEGAVDPNHPNQRGQPKRRIMSNPNANIEQEYTRWVSAEHGEPISMHHDNVLRHLRGRHIRVRDIVWLYPPNSAPGMMITGPYVVKHLSVVRRREPYPNYVNAKIQSLSDRWEVFDTEADRLMDIIPSRTSGFMSRPIGLYYKWKTSWISEMGYSNNDSNIFIRPCDEREFTVGIGDKVYIKREAGPNKRFIHNAEKVSMTDDSRSKIYEVAYIYYPYTVGARNQAVHEGRPGMWPGGGILVKIYNNRDDMDADIHEMERYPIDDVIIGIDPTRQQLALYDLMRKKDGTVVKRYQELEKLSLKF